jgi:hypothetical protein
MRNGSIPRLLEANGNIYVAFGSFADLAQTVSRGWLSGLERDDAGAPRRELRS